MKPDVSIIAPVHNAEAFLPTMLDSFLRQTFEAWEAVCVDDASLDGSWEILSSYASNDQRIRLIRNPEGKGAGWSRNLAMEHSSGRYVMFCDSDDWYEPNACEKMIQAISSKNLDLVQCYAQIEIEGSMCADNIPNIPNLEYFNPPLKFGGLFRRPHRGLNSLCWEKILSREFLSKYHICFPSCSKHEDEVFCAACAIAAKRTAILPVPLYHYRVHGGSLMQSVQADENRIWRTNVQELSAWAGANGFEHSRLLRKYIRKCEVYF